MTHRPSGAFRALLVLVTCAVTVAGVTGTAAAAGRQPAGAMAAAAPLPPTPAGLPADIEALGRYVPANSCDPTAKPGAVRLGDLLRATYPTTSYGISRTCGTDPLPTSEHYDGRAVDWMTSARTTQGKANAEAVIGWLLATDKAGHTYANARRVGVMYMIWNNRIWGSYRASEGWRPYSSCASHPEKAYDTTCHRDHVHFSLTWEGAMARTSFWSRTVAPVDYGPCRSADLNWASPYVTARATACTTYPVVKPPAGASALLKTLTTYSGMRLAAGSTGPVVRAVQQAVGASVDGSYGPATTAAVGSWQRAHQVPVTGIVDPDTWRGLLTANGATLPPAPAPTPTPTVSPLHPYRNMYLRMGSHGDAVVAAQKWFHLTADGWYGAQTRDAVNRLKSAHQLKVDGILGPKAWAAMGA